MRALFDSYLLQSSPTPSRSWRHPVEDSPWVTKRRAGLWSLRAAENCSGEKGAPGGFVRRRTSPPEERRRAHFKKMSFQNLKLFYRSFASVMT